MNLTAAQVSRLALQVDAERLSRDFGLFVRAAWSVVEPGTAFVEGAHLEVFERELAAVAAGEERRLIVNVPPRHTKSTIVGVLFPAWVWTRDPGHKFLAASYSLALSIRDNVKRRRLVESPWYQERWGSRVVLVGDQNQKTRFENTAGGFMVATSVGGSVTGEGGDDRVPAGFRAVSLRSRPCTR